MSVPRQHGHRGPLSCFTSGAPPASSLPHPAFHSSSAARYSQQQQQQQQQVYAAALHQPQQQQPAARAVDPRFAGMHPGGDYGGGCFAQSTDEHVISDYDSDESDDDDFDDEDDSFDGPLKDEYRGRAWSAGNEDVEHIPFARYQHQQQQLQHPQQQQQSQQARASWSPEDQIIARPPAHHAVSSAPPSRDLERLFDGLRRAPSQYQDHAAAAAYQHHALAAQHHHHQQQTLAALAPEPPMPVVAPPPAATTTAPTSSLFLAPFAAAAVWSLLQRPFAFQVPARKPSAIVTDDPVVGRRSLNEYGRDDWLPATPPNGPVMDYHGGQVKVGASWEEDRWARCVSLTLFHVPLSLLTRPRD